MNKLTKREQEIFSLIGRVSSNRAIAEVLSISEYTVKKHRLSIIRKMQLHSAVQLTARAIEERKGRSFEFAASFAGRGAQLGSKERTVVECICHGMTSKEIARHMAISPLTVRKHRENIMRKLGVRSLAALIDLVVQPIDAATASEP